MGRVEVAPQLESNALRCCLDDGDDLGREACVDEGVERFERRTGLDDVTAFGAKRRDPDPGA
jgi:hypothetical protein